MAQPKIAYESRPLSESTEIETSVMMVQITNKNNAVVNRKRPDKFASVV
jgi:frataxin-like iron-binding protein CyaY